MPSIASLIVSLHALFGSQVRGNSTSSNVRSADLGMAGVAILCRHQDELLRVLEKDWSYPLILKPARGRVRTRAETDTGWVGVFG